MRNFSAWIGAGVGAGLRPRLACELRPEGVVAARAEDGESAPSSLAHAQLPVGALVPGLKPGNLAMRDAVVAALRSALGQVGDRARELTLIVPDASVRVLLLEFDTLPGKPADALPIVRFRLKKMLPFEADDAAVSYQVMSTSRNLVKVLAVAMPRDVMDEYESAVRDAGYEPGAVLPSTVAALAALEEEPGAERGAAALVVNASSHAVTTAIVRDGVLLLHRSIDLGMDARVEEESEAVLAEVVEAEEAFGEPALSAMDLEMEAVQAVVMSEAAIAQEVAQAVSVAAAYYEDTLNAPLEQVLSAGPFGADGLQEIVADAVFGERMVQVREVLTEDGTTPRAELGDIPRGLLAGVVGALKV